MLLIGTIATFEMISQTDLQNPDSWNDEGVGNGHAVGCFDN